MTPESTDAYAETAGRFLDRFLGSWLGVGESGSHKIVDRMTFERVLGNRFVRFQYHALEGDTYRGEGYAFPDPTSQQIRWYEFNNGRAPLRIHSGKQVGESLVLEEHADGRDIRLVFEFLQEDTIRMTEAHLRTGYAEVYVDMLFKRE